MDTHLEDQVFARDGHELDLMRALIDVVGEVAGDDEMSIDDLVRIAVTSKGREALSPVRLELAYEAVLRLAVGPTPRLVLDLAARQVRGSGWFELTIELRDVTSARG